MTKKLYRSGHRLITISIYYRVYKVTKEIKNCKIIKIKKLTTTYKKNMMRKICKLINRVFRFIKQVFQI